MRLSRFAGYTVDNEWLVVALVAPVLLFPLRLPILTAASLILLAGLWLLRLLLRGQAWPVTPFNVALLPLLFMVGVGSLLSVAPQWTIPKVTGIILGLAVFRAVSFASQKRENLARATSAYILITTGFMVLGLMGTRWGHRKVVVLRQITEQIIPHLSLSTPELPTGHINPNQLATIPLFTFPLLLSLLLTRSYPMPSPFSRRRPALTTALLILAIVNALVLIVSQSRSAWFGAILATLFILLHRIVSGRRRRGQIIAVWLLWFVFVVAGILLLEHLRSPVGKLLASNGKAGIPLAGRREVWRHALWILQDFPLTGIGLGAFRVVAPALYPFIFFTPRQLLPDAHHILLQVGMDTGIVGLVSYLALLIIALFVASRATRSEDRLINALAVGIIATLLGIHAYGMFNAIALGAKPGVLLWFLLALAGQLETPVSRLPNVAKENKIEPKRGMVWGVSIVVSLLLLAGFYTGRDSWKSAGQRMALLLRVTPPAHSLCFPPTQYGRTLRTLHGPTSLFASLAMSQALSPSEEVTPVEAAHLALLYARCAPNLSEPQRKRVLNTIDQHIDETFAAHTLDLYFILKPSLSSAAAADLLSVLVGHAPSHARGNFELARLRYKTRRWNQAIAHAKAVVSARLSPRQQKMRIGAYRILVSSLLKTHQLNQAAKVIRTMESRSCGVEGTNVQRCKALAKRFQRSLAKAHIRDARINLRRSRQAYKAKHWNKAIRYARRVIDVPLSEETPAVESIQIAAYRILIQSLVFQKKCTEASNVWNEFKSRYKDITGSNLNKYQRVLRSTEKRLQRCQR